MITAGIFMTLLGVIGIIYHVKTKENATDSQLIALKGLLILTLFFLCSGIALFLIGIGF